jgi:four helix bundle protein
MSIKDFVAREKGIDLVVKVYAYTRQLPSDEKYVLVPQLRRAVLSIPLNLSEGYGRSSRPDFLRFIDIALGSAREVEMIFEICQRLEYPEPKAEIEMTEEVIRILLALKKSLRKD